MIRRILSLFILISGASFAQSPHFREVSREAGITASHISTPDKQYIVESMSGGVGLMDCDDDGKLDIIVVNGSTIEHFRQGGDRLITLYHQDTDFKFTDITPICRAHTQGLGHGGCSCRLR